MSNTLIQAIDYTTIAQQAIEAAIASKICCPQPVRWEPLIQCIDGTPTVIGWVGDDGTVTNTGDPPRARWHWPPTQVGGGGYSGNIDHGDGTYTDDSGDGIVSADGTIEGYSGSTKDPEQTLTPDQYLELCKKANWTVMACEKMVDNILSTMGAMNAGIGLVEQAAISAGLVGTGSTIIGITTLTVGSITLSFSAVTLLAIASVAATIFTLLDIFQVASTVKENYRAIRPQLVNAIYCGGKRSGAAIKLAWDNEINKATTWFAPQRALFKYLMTPSLANAIADPNAVVVDGVERYAYACTCPATNTYLLWVYYKGDNIWFQWHTYVWQSGYSTNACGDKGSWDKLAPNANIFRNATNIRVTNNAASTTNIHLRGNSNCAFFRYNVVLAPGESVNVTTVTGLHITTLSSTGAIVEIEDI